MRRPGEVAYEMVLSCGLALVGLWVLDWTQWIPEFRFMHDGPIMLSFLLIYLLMYPCILWLLQRRKGS